MGKFFVWIGNQSGKEKITIGGFENFHYTLIFKKNQRVVDLHKSTIVDGVKTHEQIFEMRIFTLLRLLITINSVNEYLIYNFFWFTQRINLGKLKKHRLLLMSTIYDENQTSLVMNTKRKRMIRIREEIPTELLLGMFFYPDEIDLNTHKMSFLYSTKNGRLKPEGFIFRLEHDKRTRSFYYMTNKNFRYYLRSTHVIIINLLETIEFKNKQRVIAFLQDIINKSSKQQESALQLTTVCING